MKTKLTRALAILLSAALLLSMAACQLKDETPAAVATGGNAAADADRDAVAVKIGDKYTVTKGEIADEYNYMLQMYSQYGMTPTSDADIEQMQDQIVDGLVTDKLTLYQADLMGVTLNKEQTDGVDADIEDQMQYFLKDFRTQAESEGATDPDARSIEIFNEQLKNAGLEMDVEGYREYLREAMTKNALITAVEDKVKSEVSATDEEAQAYFDNLLAAQKETYAASPADYRDDEESYEKFGGDPVLVIPENYVRIRSITIAPTEELSEEYDTLQTDMTALEAEYGKLALSDAAANAARIAEIKTSYQEKTKKSADMFETYIADARAKADEAYAKLQAGADFETVLKEYGQDELYTTYPNFVSTGVLMQKSEESTAFDPELLDAVLKLKDGEYTPVVNLDDMFYILQLVGDEKPGEKTFADVKDDMLKQAQAEKAETYLAEQKEAWLNDTSLATYFEDVYRSIGK